jgi:hypothetical protein
MKKLFSTILVIGLLFSGNGYADSIWDHLEVGMSKKEFQKKVDGNSGEGSQVQRYYKSKEMLAIEDAVSPKYVGLVFKKGNFRRYIKNTKNEIITHGVVSIDGAWKRPRFDAPDEFIWYIFENVTKPMKCTNKLFGFCTGKQGNGTLKAVVFNKYDALIIADPANTKSYEVKKIESKKRVVKKKEEEIKEAEQVKQKAEKAKKVELEKKVEAKQSELAPMINSAKDTCKTLGFEEGTDKFTDCALKLYTQEVENKVAIEVAKQQASGSSSSGSMTIYDPVRDRQNQIDRGMKMLGGGCTLGIDC